MTALSLTGGVRERLVDAAAQLTSEHGWSEVTMAKVAARAGVSRQTLYNEFGVKSSLGQAMVLAELDRFLSVVEEGLDGSRPLVESISGIVESICTMAQDNPLLRAVLSSAHGTSNDLLPYLTTQSQPLLEAAVLALSTQVGLNYPDLPLAGRERDVALESVVRLVLSHVMQPTFAPKETADDIAWLAGRLLNHRGTPGG